MSHRLRVFVVTTTIIKMGRAGYETGGFTFVTLAESENQATRLMVVELMKRHPSVLTREDTKTTSVPDEFIREAALALGMKSP